MALLVKFGPRDRIWPVKTGEHLFFKYFLKSNKSEKVLYVKFQNIKKYCRWISDTMIKQGHEAPFKRL